MAEGLFAGVLLAERLIGCIQDTLAGSLSALVGAEKPLSVRDRCKGDDPQSQVESDTGVAVLRKHAVVHVVVGAEEWELEQFLVGSGTLA